MPSRRDLLAGIGTMTMLSTAGCMSTNNEVSDHYSRGYESYSTANAIDSNNELDVALTLYERSVDSFNSAKDAAENETVEQYCYEARELAIVSAEETATKIRQHKADQEETNGESDNENDSDLDYSGPDYNTIDSSSFAETIGATERARVRKRYEMRSPSTVERRTRLPF